MKRLFATIATIAIAMMVPSNGQDIATETDRVNERVDQLLSQMTVEEKVSLCHANSKFTIAGVERLGIPEMWMSDGPHGVREEISRDSWASANWTNDHATYLPPLTAVAASFNPEMATLHGTVLGAEARDRGKDVILGPGVNLARVPLYGRNFEYLGEDPFLASKLVVPEIIAIQKNDVAACVKHYALNTQEWNRTGVNAKPDERTLREIYLPAFEAAVKQAKVWTVMGAYNEFRGTNCNQSKHLVKDILKTQWGFQGLLMTDWNCDINTHDAAMHGLDIEMGTNVESYDDYFLARPFLEAIQSGKIPMDVLDDKVRRILRVQVSIGMMNPNRKPGSRGTDQHHRNAREIIDQGIVLLKNESRTLPLRQSEIKRVLVMGPNADVAHGHGGGSSQVKAPFEITPLQGLLRKLGEEVEITHYKAAPPASEGLRPISPNFVITKDSGAGTPAWKRLTYTKPTDKKQSNFQWTTTSTLTFDDDAVHHERLIAEVQPIQSGMHTFQVEADGDFDLSLNDRIILKATESMLGEIKTTDVTLDAGETYKVRLIYSGKRGCTVGWKAPGDRYVDRDVYLATAKSADAVIYFGGLNHSHDREAEDRSSMRLPGSQDRVIEELAAANPNTVVVLLAGSAVEMPWIDKVSSLVWGWYGGMFAGDAYADVLFGDVVPSGKMPITLAKSLSDNPHVVLDDYNAAECLYKEGVFMGYRWFESQNIEPLFPFGHGLSYTDFEISDLRLSSQSIASDEAISVTVKVTNIGKRRGAEVVQLYVQDVQSSVPRPAKELQGFQKVFLEPNQARDVLLTLSQRDLAFWDIEANDWKAEPGTFKIHVGASLTDIRLTGAFDLQ